MRKAVIILAVAVFLFGLTVQAMAYFSPGDLIEVVYKSGGTGNEVLTDPGSASSWTTPGSVPTTNFTTGITTSALSTMFPGASWSDLNVAYFVMTGTGPSASFWTSGPATGQINDGSQKSATKSAMSSVLGLAAQNAGSGNQAVQGSTSSANTYWNLLDKAGLSVGQFGNFIDASTPGEANLAALTSGGSVNLYLYYYPNATSNSAGTGVQVAELTISNNGTTGVTAAPSTVPVPAPVVLLGSGLLGLIGIRRRQTV